MIKKKFTEKQIKDLKSLGFEQVSSGQMIKWCRKPAHYFSVVPYTQDTVWIVYAGPSYEEFIDEDYLVFREDIRDFIIKHDGAKIKKLIDSILKFLLLKA